MVIFHFYRNFHFAWVDLVLGLSYLWRNPFSICRAEMERLGEREVHVYGETPLTTWAKIAKAANLSSKDVFYDLGCGRGRICFWTKLWIGCPTVGIDRVPYFIQKASRLANWMGFSDVSFLQSRIAGASLEEATAIYLYTFHPDEDSIDISRLKRGSLVITLSEPIYNKRLVLKTSLIGRFPWGEAQVFIQQVSI